MKTKYFIGIIGLISVSVLLATTCFAQDCVVSQKGSGNLIIASCPDGSKTVDVGGRIDLYRVGDRINISGSVAPQVAHKALANLLISRPSSQLRLKLLDADKVGVWGLFLRPHNLNLLYGEVKL